MPSTENKYTIDNIDLYDEVEKRLKISEVPYKRTDKTERDTIYSVLLKEKTNDAQIRILSQNLFFYSFIDEIINVWKFMDTKKDAEEFMKKMYPWEYKNIILPDRMVKIDEDAVVIEKDILIDQVVDYITLVGNKSDDIPGVIGCGEKSAIEILRNFQSVDLMLHEIKEYEENDNLDVLDNIWKEKFKIYCSLTKILNQRDRIKEGMKKLNLS